MSHLFQARCSFMEKVIACLIGGHIVMTKKLHQLD